MWGIAVSEVRLTPHYAAVLFSLHIGKGMRTEIPIQFKEVEPLKISIGRFVFARWSVPLHFWHDVGHDIVPKVTHNGRRISENTIQNTRSLGL